MRIARFTTGEDPQYGVVTGDVDDLGIPADDTVLVALAGDPLYVGVQLTDKEIPLSEVRLLAPVLPRSKVVGIGRNYAAHATEMGNDVPDEPMMFIKPNTSVVGPGDPVFYPRQSADVHYEGELAVVIGRICRDVAPERVGEVVYGYTVGNDVTARDLQRKDVQFTRAKGFDSFCPLGPWIETELDTGDLQADHAPQRRHRAGRHHEGHDLRRADARVARLLGDDAAARRRDPHRHPRGCRTHERRRRGRGDRRRHRLPDQQGGFP